MFIQRPFIRRLFALFGLVAALFLTNCSEKPQPTPDDGELSTFEVDTSITPYIDEMPGFDGQPRPIGAVVDADGEQVEFVENELILVTDDDAKLDEFVDRWSGEVVEQIDFSDLAVNRATHHVVRIETDGARTDELGAIIDELYDSQRRGDLTFSSERGLELFAVAADETATGLEIGISWIGRAHGFLDRTTTEAATGEGSYTTNAFGWPSHTEDSGPEIGTAEAWRTLRITGGLDNEVGIAILDQGFRNTTDGLPANIDYRANPPFTDPFRKAMDKAGHGEKAARAAFGTADDSFGAAGAAGSVADAQAIYTGYGIVTSISALVKARRGGAKIANMSYGAKVPAIGSFAVRPFNITTRRMSDNGMLIFAAAGNDGDNVEAERCLGPFERVCWEKRWYAPCENDGVICVGGLAWNSRVKDASSNFGDENVDIWAPYVMWLGPDESETANDATLKAGTSYSSPYTAGIAALTWAANPELSADEVRNILYETAHLSGDTDVNRVVNALGAVLGALEGVETPPYVEIVSPVEGSSYVSNAESVTLEATIEDLEGDIESVTWGSDLDGQIGTGRLTSVSDLSVGTHEISVRVRDAADNTAEASTTITVTNAAPTVELVSPTDGETFYQSQTVPLQATTFDPNELGPLPDENVQWYVGDGAPVGQGSSTSLPGGTFTVGTHTVEVVASDGDLEARDSVDITIEQDPAGNVDPTVVITEPDAGASFLADQTDSDGDNYARIAVCGYGVDPEDGQIHGSDAQWYVREVGASVWQLLVQDTGPNSCPNADLYLRDPDFTEYELLLRVTDSDGGTGETQVDITVTGLI